MQLKNNYSNYLFPLPRPTQQTTWKQNEEETPQQQQQPCCGSRCYQCEHMCTLVFEQDVGACVGRERMADRGTERQRRRRRTRRDRETKLWFLMTRHEPTRARWETTCEAAAWVYSTHPEHQHHNTTQHTTPCMLSQPPDHTAHPITDTFVKGFVRTPTQHFTRTSQKHA